FFCNAKKNHGFPRQILYSVGERRELSRPFVIDSVNRPHLGYWFQQRSEWQGINAASAPYQMRAAYPVLKPYRSGVGASSRGQVRAARQEKHYGSTEVYRFWVYNGIPRTMRDFLLTVILA